jgi:hypothetical protein
MAKGHHGHHHGKHRKDGGETPMVASGNPNVIKEAERVPQAWRQGDA